MTSQEAAKSNHGFAVKIAEDINIPLSQRLQLIDHPLPQLNSGQVLIQVLASPVNPSDLVFLYGKYGVEPKDGQYAGFEGCGRVIAANAGLYGKWLVDKRVAMSAPKGGAGCWSRFMVTHANFCLPLRKEISNEQGATLIVNPMTAVCLLERAKQLGSKAVVVNAAASQVGKGIIRYAKRLGIKTIATVRSSANLTVLENLGADRVLLSTAADFAVQLKQACMEYQATVLLDAIAGDETAMILRLMPYSSTAVIYGRLTDTHEEIDGSFGVSDMIFRNCRIEGFWLATFIRNASIWRVIQLSRKVQRLFVQGVFDTEIYGTFGFNDFPAALNYYAENKSIGKVIFVPD